MVSSYEIGNRDTCPVRLSRALFFFSISMILAMMMMTKASSSASGYVDSRVLRAPRGW